jgi:hypothetical protein
MFRERESLLYCNKHFGHYGSFATLPLVIAIFNSGNIYCDRYERSLRGACGQPGATYDQMQKFIPTLEFPGSDYFTVDDYYFLMKLSGSPAVRSPEKIATDREEILEERNKKTILKSHARILLKAVTFWELRHAERVMEWAKGMAETFMKEMRRKRPSEDEIDDGTPIKKSRFFPGSTARRWYIDPPAANAIPAPATDDVDEGYHST